MTQRLSSSKLQPGEVWPDENGVAINAHGGGILFHDDRFYWFGEHKVEGTLGNTAQVGVHCYSSTDLVHWADEGIALAVSDDPQSDITRGCILERPKVLFHSGTRTFVMWFHLELIGQRYRSARSGVAVSDSPTGPYRFVESFRPNAGVWPENLPAERQRPLSAEEKALLEDASAGGPIPPAVEELRLRDHFAGGQMARDMTVFKDEDGLAYHIYASEGNGTLHLSQLSDDYRRPRGRFIRILPGRYHEAPAMFKRNGVYFMITSGCTGWAPNAARLLRAESIWGPWTELPNPCEGSPEQVETTFQAQSTHVLQLQNGEDIFMADRWAPENAIDGRYVWLPIEWVGDLPVIRWRESWVPALG